MVSEWDGLAVVGSPSPTVVAARWVPAPPRTHPARFAVRRMSSTILKRVSPLVIVDSVICLVIGWSVASTFIESHRAAEMSAQLALFKEAEALLDAYRAENGSYPESLDTLEFSFPDGGDRSTLALLKYETNGKTYSLATKRIVRRGASSITLTDCLKTR